MSISTGTSVARSAVVHRGVLAVAVMSAVVAAVVAAHDGAAARAAALTGPELTRVLRFMALVKAALATGALWWADRRLRHPATPVVAAAWIAACAPMAAATVLIWSLAHVAAGAAAFHAGFALLLVLGLTDRASTSDAAAWAKRGFARGLGAAPRGRAAADRRDPAGVTPHPPRPMPSA